MPPATSRPSALHRLGTFCYRRHWLVAGVWCAAIVVVFAAAGAVGTGYASSFDDFDSEATRGLDLLEEHWTDSSGGENAGMLVFIADEGIDDPGVQADIEAIVADVAEIDDVTVVSPYDGPMQIAQQGPYAGQLGFARVQFGPQYESWGDVQEVAGDIADIVVPAAEDAGLRLELGGQPFAEFEPPESESLGLGFAIIILIVAFGSVVAMGLPIGMALGGIGIGIAIVGMASHLLPMPEFTPTVAVMIGLGVGIDYALFIVTRYREDLHRGMEPMEAAGVALDTAGRAVLFAGTTVVISVLGMIVMGLGFIRGLGIGAAIPVATTMIASITLLPAFLGFAGTKLEVTRWRGLIAALFVAAALIGMGLGFPSAVVGLAVALLVLLVGTFVPTLTRTLPPRKQKPLEQTFAYRYSRLIQRRPWLGAIAGFVILAVLAIPVFQLRLGFSDQGNAPEGTTTREAYDLIAEGFGPGFNGPLVLVAEVPDGSDQAVQAVSAALQDTQGIALASPAEPSEDGQAARWFVLPETSPQDADTVDLVNRLRHEVLPRAEGDSGLEVQVSSMTAINVDFTEYLGGRYLAFFAVVLGLSFLLLMAVFRSLLVPLKAVIMNLLSIGAAYGIVVAIFQWGWGGAALDIGPAPIEPFMPMMLFAIVFGLSMDYEVFLLSRMKEEYDRTGDNASAVTNGLAVTARVITAAAAIMVVVFGSFVLESDRLVKLMGIGLAVAVFLDATIVRMLLVPSTMELLGDRNWWLPRWLDRILPVINVEPSDPHPEVAPVATDTDEHPEERELVGTSAPD